MRIEKQMNLLREVKISSNLNRRIPLDRLDSNRNYKMNEINAQLRLDNLVIREYFE